MTDYTVNDVYAGLNQFKDYIQANLPYKFTCFTGLLDPSVSGFDAPTPSSYFRVDSLTPPQNVTGVWYKSGPNAIDWTAFGSGGGGSGFLVGNVDPTTEGVDGNFYIQTATNKIYQKVAGTWGVVLQSTAATTSYDNTNSGLTATTTQAAIDEVVVKKLTGIKGLVDPSIAPGYAADIPALYMQVDNMTPAVGVLLNTYIKIGPADTDWQIFGGVIPMATTWYIGTGLPSPTLGVDGDWYFDETVTARGVYSKVAGSWVQKLLGTNWYSGGTVPSNSLGLDGDFYLRTSGANEIYLKAAGSWSVALTGGGGGGSPQVWTVVSSDFTLQDGFAYIVDTSAAVANVTATLGTASPTNSFNAWVKDAKGTFGTTNKNLIIQKALGATYTIANDTNPLTVDVNYASLHLVFDSVNNNIAI